MQPNQGVPPQQQPPYPQQQPPYPQQQPYPPQGPGYPPQYGMQQYPYYPPQKRGMPGWAIALIIVGILVVFVLPVMAIAAIPLITTNTRDARRAEGEQLMYSARDYCRVQYSKSGVYPTSLREVGAGYGDFDGEYYKVYDAVRPISGPSSKSGSSYTTRPADGGYGYSQWAEITCTPTSKSDGRGHCEFDWASGNSTVRWD